MKYIVRHCKDSSKYQIFTKLNDALKFIDLNPSWVLE